MDGLTNAERDEHDANDGQHLSDGEIHEERAILAGVRRAPGGDRVEKMRAIVEAHAMMEIDGTVVDVQSAHAVVTVYDALTQETNKIKFMNMPVEKMVAVAWKLVSR